MMTVTVENIYLKTMLFYETLAATSPRRKIRFATATLHNLQNGQVLFFCTPFLSFLTTCFLLKNRWQLSRVFNTTSKSKRFHFVKYTERSH